MVGESSIQSGAAPALNAKTVQQQIRIVSADEKDLTRLGFINQDLAAQWAFCQVAAHDFSSTSLDWPQARYGSLLNRTSVDRRPISKVGSHVKINVDPLRPILSITKRLTRRSSQPLAVPMFSFQMTSISNAAAKVASASGG